MFQKIPISRRFNTSSFLLYADGLVERRGEGIDQGLGRLHAAVEVVMGQPPAVICHHLTDALLAGQTVDDVAVVLLRIGH